LKHDTLKQFLKFALNQRINGNPVAPIVWSSTGVGKTHTIKEFANDIGANLVVLHLSSQEPGDLVGLPARDELNQLTKWLRPEWFPDENSEETFIIFLDEFNRCHKSVMDVMLPFLLEGQIHTHKVPKNTLIVAAANPDDGENYSVTSIDDKAMLSRLCHIKLNSDYDSWKSFCGENVHKAMITVAGRAGKFGESCPLPEIHPDPRSMHVAGSALKDITKEELDLWGVEFLKGMIGELGTAVFEEIRSNGFKKFNVSARDIFSDYSSVKDKVKEAATENVAAIAELTVEMHDLILAGELKSENGNLGKEELANVAEFIMDLPDETVTSFLVRIIKSISSTDQNGRDNAITFLQKVGDHSTAVLNKVTEISSR